MYQSQRTREDILKSSIKKCDIDEGNGNVIRLDVFHSAPFEN